MMEGDDAIIATSKDHQSIIDNTIHTILPARSVLEQRRSTTPSSLEGISPKLELLHRLHGTSILQDACTLLHLSPSTYATSTTIFHHYYHRVSLTKYDVWSTSLACLLLATKLEEEARTIRTIIITFGHIYRRRRLRIHDDMEISYGYADCEALASTFTNSEKENVLRSGNRAIMAVGGKVYSLWKETMMKMEYEILSAFGFTLFWVSEVHPHKFLLYFCRVLEIDAQDSLPKDDGADDGGDGNGGGSGGIAQKAWSYCNDSCSLDLCVRYDPEVIVSQYLLLFSIRFIHHELFAHYNELPSHLTHSIIDTTRHDTKACAAILMASSYHDVNLPLLPRPWWEAFIGPNRGQDLSIVCNAILALDDETNMDIRRSKYAFVPSLVRHLSFNDPDSYLWSVSD